MLLLLCFPPVAIVCLLYSLLMEKVNKIPRKHNIKSDLENIRGQDKQSAWRGEVKLRVWRNEENKP